MKVGDLVTWNGVGPSFTAVIIGFNEKGDGGKDFVHLFHKGKVLIVMAFDISLV